MDLTLSETYKNDSGKYFDNDECDSKGHFSTAHSDVYNENKVSVMI